MEKNKARIAIIEQEFKMAERAEMLKRKEEEATRVLFSIDTSTCPPNALVVVKVASAI